MGWIVAAGFIAVCLALVLLPRRTVQGRAVSLLRCFFPSWRFFEEIEPGPVLSVSEAPADGDFGAFRELLEPPARHAGTALLNPYGNLHLAAQSLVEQLWSELEEGTDASQLVAYRLVAHLVEFELRAAERSPGARFRFRITSEGSLAFESTVHELG